MRVSWAGQHTTAAFNNAPVRHILKVGATRSYRNQIGTQRDVNTCWGHVEEIYKLCHMWWWQTSHYHSTSSTVLCLLMKYCKRDGRRRVKGKNEPLEAGKTAWKKNRKEWLLTSLWGYYHKCVNYPCNVWKNTFSELFGQACVPRNGRPCVPQVALCLCRFEWRQHRLTNTNMKTTVQKKKKPNVFSINNFFWLFLSFMF